MVNGADSVNGRSVEALGRALDRAEAEARPYWAEGCPGGHHWLGVCPECEPVFERLRTAAAEFFAAYRAAAPRPDHWARKFSGPELDAFGRVLIALDEQRAAVRALLLDPATTERERIVAEVELERAELYADVLRAKWRDRYAARKAFEAARKVGKTRRIKTVTVDRITYKRTGRYDTDMATGERYEILTPLEIIR